MRIISSDRRYDFQYAQIIIEVDDNCIFAHPAFDVSKNYLIARYSTKEKVEKAMQKLHEAYAPEPLFIHKDISPDERAAAGEISWAQALNEMRTGMFVRPIPDSSIEQVYTGNVVFRFPQEDEI